MMNTEDWIKFGATLVTGTGGIGLAAYVLAPAIERMADRRLSRQQDNTHSENVNNQMMAMQKMMNDEFAKRAEEWNGRFESQQKEIVSLTKKVERSDNSRLFLQNRVLKMSWGYDDLLSSVRKICDAAKDGKVISDNLLKEIELKPSSDQIINEADRDTIAQMKMNDLTNGNTGGV